MASSGQLLQQIISTQNGVNFEEKKTLEAILDARVIITEDIKEPPVCLSITHNDQEYVIGTLGNFSCITGKAKSRKSFTVAMATAAALSTTSSLNIKSKLPPDQKNILYFDTEQAKFHVVSAARRIVKLAEKDSNQHPENLHIFCLRKYNPSERLKIIDYLIYHTPNLGLVIIDGIRDLITSINDEEQSTFITSKLLKWTEELNIHIMCVLHLNKSNGEARGHIGSEINNKAETVLTVTKEEENLDISIVSSAQARHKDIQPFAFSIDEDGLPEIIEDYEFEPPKNESKNKGGRPKIDPRDIPFEIHKNYVGAIFLGAPAEGYKYGVLLKKVKETYKHGYSSFGDNKAKQFLMYIQDNGMIHYNNGLYKLPSTPEDEDLPF